MLDSSFDSVLYKDSPFVPPATVQAAFQIAKLVTEDGYPPAIAIAHELRDLFGEHLQFLDSNAEWMIGKFGVNQEHMDDYYFGLLIPVTLILASHMARYNRFEDVINHYFPLSDDSQFFLDLQNYGTRHISLAGSLLVNSPDPMLSADPVFRHCRLEVFSFSYWYQVGLEAGERTYRQFAQLY